MTNKPTFFVGRPDGWIQRRPDRMLDVVPLYKNILKILNEYGYPYTIGGIKTAPRGHDIVLAHHTNEPRKNVWNIKKGYFPNLLNWDRTGYSGWAEMADNGALFKKTQDVDIEDAVGGFYKFANDYISSNESKFPQAEGSFNVDGPYVFVACQRPRDTVAVWARIDTLKLAHEVAKSFRGTEYKVVIKRHPKEAQFDLSTLNKSDHVILSDHSIHEIIPNSSAVFTVNSGVGLEACLHMKPVYTTGKSDYEWVTRKISTVQELKHVPSTLQPLSEAEKEAIIKFVYYMLTEHFVNALDIESVRKKINMCVSEWRDK